MSNVREMLDEPALDSRTPLVPAYGSNLLKITAAVIFVLWVYLLNTADSMMISSDLVIIPRISLAVGAIFGFAVGWVMVRANIKAIRKNNIIKAMLALSFSVIFAVILNDISWKAIDMFDRPVRSPVMTGFFPIDYFKTGRRGPTVNIRSGAQDENIAVSQADYEFLVSSSREDSISRCLIARFQYTEHGTKLIYPFSDGRKKPINVRAC